MNIRTEPIVQEPVGLRNKNSEIDKVTQLGFNVNELIHLSNKSKNSYLTKYEQRRMEELQSNNSIIAYMKKRGLDYV